MLCILKNTYTRLNIFKKINYMYYYIIIIIRYEFIKGNDINFQNWGEKYHDFTINDKILIPK